MRRAAAILALAVLVAGCGGKKQSSAPTTALLTDVQAAGDSVTFTFKSAPHDVLTGYMPTGKIAQSGSGAPVKIAAPRAVVVHFRPAATADLQGDQAVPTYPGPNRLQGTGPVRDVVKVSDFESDLGWAIGIDRRLPVHVSRDGSTVTITFG